MFWNYNQSSSPQIDNVFCREDLTLQELLDHENILQELKSQNKKLIDFLLKPEVLNELVTLITTEPGADIPEEERYKHPNIACELLTTDIPAITENLASDATLLSKLYSFLETEPPLNPLLASFFSRTMGVLVVRRTEQNWYSYQFTCLQVLEWLKSKETSISLLLKHLGTSAIMDLTLKLVTQVEGFEMKQNLLNFLASQGLVEKLVGLLAPSAGTSLNANAALLLCDIIVKSREAQLNCENKPEPDPILSSLESIETIKSIVEVIHNGEKSESSIVGGISVLLTLLEPSKSVNGSSLDSGNMALNYGGEGGGGGGSGDSPAPSPPPPVALTTIEAIVPFLPAFHDLLLNPPKKPAVRLTCCTVDPPLGNTRLQVVRLLAALIATHNRQVEEQLDSLGTIQVLLDLFFKYSLNNFLHTQVEKCLNAALAVDTAPSETTPDNLLISNIFVKCRLLNRIAEAWKENTEEQSKPGGFRKGYMGHLTRLSLALNTQIEKSLGEWLKEHVTADELILWQEFSAGPLAEVKKQLNACLGGKHPAQSSSDDDERNFRNIPFQQDGQFQQQIYTEYQTQQVASQLIENFGYHESEFNDPEDNMNPSVDRLADLSFSVTDEEELERQQELFQQVCSQKIQCLDEEDDEDMWSDNHIVSRRKILKLAREFKKNGFKWVWVQGGRIFLKNEDNGSTIIVRSQTDLDNLTWNGGEEIANYNSSDDEERPRIEGREEGRVHSNQADPWVSGIATVAPTVEPANPWGDESAGTTPETGNNEGWANFEANFDAANAFDSPSDSSLTSVPVDSEASSIPSPNVSAESRSEPLGAISTDTKDDASENKDDNANPSLPPGEVTQLIDNFRFLSSQGLITEESKSPNVQAPVDLNPKPSDSGGSPENPVAGEIVTESPTMSEPVAAPVSDTSLPVSAPASDTTVPVATSASDTTVPATTSVSDTPVPVATPASDTPVPTPIPPQPEEAV